MLEKEEKVFKDKFGELVKSDLGKFILIKDDLILGSFESMVDALKEGYSKFKEAPFLVKQVLPAQQPLNFANNSLVI